MRTATSAYELVEAGLFRDAARAIDQSSEVSRELRVLRARLEDHIGTPLLAKATAEQLLREGLNHREQTACWDIIGRVTLYSGRTTEGLKALNQAIASAQATGDLKLEARARVSYIEGLVHWVGIEPAILEIQNVRQAAIRAADPYSLIELHWLDAEIKAKRGLVSAAAVSIASAQRLLRRSSNLGQQGRVAIVASGIAIIQSDYQDALNNALEALQCAERSGSRELRIPALNNLAYIRLVQQEYEEAEKYLYELLAMRTSDSTDIGVRDTAMMLALAKGDLPRATTLANEISGLGADPLLVNSYYMTWHLPTRIRWLFRVGNVELGLQTAVEALPVIEKRGDRNLLDRIRLLAAEGYERSGQSSLASETFATAVNSNPDPSLELMAEQFRVAGRLAVKDDIAGACEHFELSGRILKSIGNLARATEVEQDLAAVLGNHNAVPTAVHVHKSTPKGRRSPLDHTSAITGRIAALVEFGAHAPLLAKETLTLFAESKAVRHATIAETTIDGDQDPPEEDASSNTLATSPEALVRIPIGRHRNTNYEIRVSPLPTAAARIALLSLERLVRISLRVARARQLEREKTTLWPDQTPEQQLGLICASERMLDLVKTIRRVAGSNLSVLLTGETGVGKELFARALHQASTRSEKVFLPFNCTAVPREMFDSQLFGHRRGSFTGAIDDSPGMIRAAAGGTLFLDEIGEMSLDTQPKLLRFLESGEIRPLGDPRPQLVDVRIVAATNAHLDRLVADGQFREDLYYRLNVIRINIPPLRERREEIPALVEHFRDRYGRELQKPQLRVADETLEYLVLYRWPGNVRQLANEVRRMVALAEPGAVLMPAHLSDDIAASRKTIPTERPALHSTEVMTRLDQPLSAALEHIERAAIQRALALAEGNLVEAARMLGLSRKGLYLKRQRLGLA